MDPRDKAIIIQRYTERFKRLGAGAEALGSGCDEHQAIRYKVLSGIGDMGGKTVLDVGCGFGGFYNYNWHLGEQMQYTGIDIVPALVQKASELHEDGRFEVRDVFDFPDTMQFDYVVSSQAFNNKLTYSDNWDVMQEVLKKGYRIARMGVAIDMVSSFVDFREDHLYYYDPAKVFEFCKGLTKRVQLRHDYPLFEFCIYMFPDFKGWRSSC